MRQWFGGRCIWLTVRNKTRKKNLAALALRLLCAAPDVGGGNIFIYVCSFFPLHARGSGRTRWQGCCLRISVMKPSAASLVFLLHASSPWWPMKACHSYLSSELLATVHLPVCSTFVAADERPPAEASSVFFLFLRASGEREPYPRREGEHPGTGELSWRSGVQHLNSLAAVMPVAVAWCCCGHSCNIPAES